MSGRTARESVGGPVWTADDYARAEAAGFTGMSAKVFLATYGHHQPDFLHLAIQQLTSFYAIPYQLAD